jgi:hypothetical protein
MSLFSRKKKTQPPAEPWVEPETVELIPRAGACTVSRRVLDGTGRPRWMVREESKAPADNGWVILSEADDEQFLASADAFTIVDFNRVATIEPALLAIWDFPVGSDLELVLQDGRRFFVDARTGERVPDDLHPPRPPGA